MSRSYCRLYLATPRNFKLPEIEQCLKSAIQAGDIASLLIRHDDDEKLKLAANRLTKIAQGADIAVLIENNIEIAKTSGSDGVQIAPNSDELLRAREILGADAIVGVNCHNHRHSAMALAEAGADYVGFETGDALELEANQNQEPVAHWWARVFEVPCVMMDAEDIEQTKKAIAAGIDFVCPGDAMWQSTKAASQNVALFNQLIKDTAIDAL